MIKKEKHSPQDETKIRKIKEKDFKRKVARIIKHTINTHKRFEKHKNTCARDILLLYLPTNKCMDHGTA